MTAEFQPPPPKGALPSAIRRFWRDYRLFITGVLAVAALILGFIGFSIQEQSWSVSDRLYASLELFRLFMASTRQPNNIYLEIAKWLAPATVAYAALQGLAALFANQVEAWWIRRRRNHVVICGLGRCGIGLAKSFRNRSFDQDRKSVVVIDRNPTSADRRACKDLNVPVLIGDARDLAILDQAGLKQAEYLIAVCGDDAINSVVASAALSGSTASGSRTTLRCFIHIGDDRLTEQLEKLSLERPSQSLGRHVQFEWFNVYGLGAKALLNTDPSLLETVDGPSPHLIVVGTGLLGRKLVAEAARRWSHGQHTTRIRITLVAADAENVCKDLKTEFADLSKVCDLEAHAIDAADVKRAGRLNISRPTDHSRTRAFVCLDDDDACLKASIQIREALPKDVDVVASTTGGSGVATFLRRGSGVLNGVQEFALLDRALTQEMLLRTLNEQIAQQLHADYLASRSLQTEAEDHEIRALVPWDRLGERFQEANREKASSIGGQLDKFDLRLVRNDAWRAPITLLTDSQVEQLAKLEHSRWRANKEDDGWHLNPKRDDKKKLNPYLVEWSELPEEIQDIDRNFARSLPRILASAGYAIRRKVNE